MIDTLYNLTDRQKQAAIVLACQVIACTSDQVIRMDDEDVMLVADAFFGDIDMMHFKRFLQDGFQLGGDGCVSIVRGFDKIEKQAFQFLLTQLIHDKAYRMNTAATLLRLCGFEPHGQNEMKPLEEKDYGIEKEDEGASAAQFVRVIDTSAIRGESSEVFTLMSNDGTVVNKVTANYDEWISKEWCPSNGIVGIIGKQESTLEGNLCYVAFGTKHVVPILERGLEKIDAFEWQAKAQYNFILAHDKGGVRCKELREGRYQPKAIPLRKHAGNRIRFVSSRFIRVENGIESLEYAQRLITFEYNAQCSEVDINIKGVMQPKHARIVHDNGRVLKYVDTTNPMFRYEIETDPVSNRITRFSMFVGNMIEYRYLN